MGTITIDSLTSFLPSPIQDLLNNVLTSVNSLVPLNGVGASILGVGVFALILFVVAVAGLSLLGSEIGRRSEQPQLDADYYYDPYYQRSLFGDLDLISYVSKLLETGEEAWTKYDSSNPDCMNRLLCDIYQDRKLDTVSSGIDGITEWAGYMDVLGIQDMVSEYTAEARQAMYTGRGQVDCGYIYYSCNFSISHTLNNNFNTNHIDEEQLYHTDYLDQSPQLS